MSSERRMKKISLDTLEVGEKKVTQNKLKRFVFALTLTLLLAVGAYGAYSLVAGEILVSRFVVNQMNCPACVITVQEVTTKLPGVVRTDVSLAGQTATVEFRGQQTDSEKIREAIAHAGYPVKIDGLLKTASKNPSERIAVTVNGKPLVIGDFNFPLQPETIESSGRVDPAARLFSIVGKEILLQAADARNVLAQPKEVEQKIEEIRTKRGLSTEDFAAKINGTYGSSEKFNQIVGQALAVQKLIEDYILEGVADSALGNRKTVEWVGSVFRDADVRIVDQGLRETVQATGGQDDWKTFWPRMIGKTSELKGLLVKDSVTNN